MWCEEGHRALPYDCAGERSLVEEPAGCPGIKRMRRYIVNEGG